MKLRLQKHLTKHNFAAFILIAAAVSLLIVRLGSLVPGLAVQEQQLPSVHESLDTAWNDPLMLPFTLCQLLVAAILPFNGYGASRLPAVLFGGVLLILMYWLLKSWYGQRLALFGTALLATSPWLLHVARLANPSILFPLSMVILLVLFAAWHRKERSSMLLYASAFVSGLLIYIPGSIWLLLILALLERRNIFESLKSAKRHAAIATLIMLGLLAPLVHNLALRWQDFVHYLGWQGGHDTLLEYPLRFVQVWQHIFIGGGTSDPVFNLGGLPLINVLMTLAFAVGVYLYTQHKSATRTILLATWWLVGTVLISLPLGSQSSLLLPLVIVLATGGLGYLLHLWLKVFPRNPLARSFGIGLIALLIAFGVAYNLRNYFVAWPHNSETVQAFSRRV